MTERKAEAKSLEPQIAERYNGNFDYQHSTFDALSLAKYRFQECRDLVKYYSEEHPTSIAIPQKTAQALLWGEAICEGQNGNWEPMKHCLLNRDLDPWGVNVYYSSEGNYRKICSYLACSLPCKK